MSYDPIPDLAAFLDGFTALLDQCRAGITDADLSMRIGMLAADRAYLRLRGGLLLDEPGREAVTTGTAIREALRDYLTKGGRLLSEADTEALAAEAERGYGPARLTARPRIVCLCGSTRFYDAYQQAYYDQTMAGEIVLSVGFYPHATSETGHGEGVGHDSEQKAGLDVLHLRKVDLADYVLVVSDESGYFGESTRREIAYAVRAGKPVAFLHESSRLLALSGGLIPAGGADDCPWC